MSAAARQTTKDPKFRRLVARHEVGHAVIAHVLGCPVQMVKITRLGGYAITSHTPVRRGRQPDPLRRAIVNAAGAQAEFWRRSRVYKHAVRTASLDVRSTLRLGFRGASVSTIDAMAHHFVTKYIATIRRVARELDKRGTMMADDFESVVGIPFGCEG